MRFRRRSVRRRVRGAIHLPQSARRRADSPSEEASRGGGKRADSTVESVSGESVDFGGTVVPVLDGVAWEKTSRGGAAPWLDMMAAVLTDACDNIAVVFART